MTKDKHCFDNFDRSGTFDTQIFTKVKIGKAKIWGFEELKMLFRFAAGKILCIYKS